MSCARRLVEEDQTEKPYCSEEGRNLNDILSNGLLSESLGLSARNFQR